MQIVRRFPLPNYQFYIGVIIGLIVSLFFNEMFQISITISKVPESRSLAPEQNLLYKIENVTSLVRKRVKVLCYVLTYPRNHRTRSIHVKRTWGKRCDKLLFISSSNDSAIDTVVIPNAENNRDWLWGKTKGALKYAWENYKDEFDWILKADDDTYVIVENLKKFLSNYSPTDPIFFGCKFSSREIPSWPSGGAGYVLSNEALRRFVLDGLPNPGKCRQDNEGAEDAELAKCLTQLGVTLEDSRDSLGRHRFLPFPPRDHLFPHTLDQKDKDYWYWKDLSYPQVQGMDCCANDAITYHYITESEMYEFEYFLYHLRPHGVYQEERYVQEYPLEYTDSTLTTTNPESVQISKEKTEANGTSNK